MLTLTTVTKKNAQGQERTFSKPSGAALIRKKKAADAPAKRAKPVPAEADDAELCDEDAA